MEENKNKTNNLTSDRKYDDEVLQGIERCRANENETEKKANAINAYFTVTGINHRFGKGIFEKGMKVELTKDPSNEYDKEAIKVELPGIGTVGYVANSPQTVIGDSMSAGRLYDKIGDTAIGTVLYPLDYGIVCKMELSI